MFNLSQNSKDLLKLNKYLLDDLYFYTVGWFFGYPPCCTVYFIERSEAFNSQLEEDFINEIYPVNKAVSGTGFVPCQNCQHNHSLSSLSYYVGEHRHPECLPFNELYAEESLDDYVEKTYKGDLNELAIEFLMDITKNQGADDFIKEIEEAKKRIEACSSEDIF
jgi:hypothetical protein